MSYAQPRVVVGLLLVLVQVACSRAVAPSVGGGSPARVASSTPATHATPAAGNGAMPQLPAVACPAYPCVKHPGSGLYARCLAGEGTRCDHYGAPCDPTP